MVPDGFSFKPEDASYLFDSEGHSQWASASAELLATLAALHLFDHLKPAQRLRRFPEVIPAVTDNKGNEALARKQSSTKWPLMVINIQLSHHLMKAMLKLDLRWRPRGENQDADDLTNQKYGNFSPEKRITCEPGDLPLSLLNKLWDTKAQFDKMRRQFRPRPQVARGPMRSQCGSAHARWVGADCATTRVLHAASRGVYHQPEKNKGLSVCVCFHDLSD